MAKQKTRQKELDPAVWMPRGEAARILHVSRMTISRWESQQLRATSTIDPWGRTTWFVNVADVERLRLERLGPKMAELESLVLSELEEGKTAINIVRTHPHVTLEDVQRIRDLASHLSGALIVQPAEASELRVLLDANVVDGPSLVRHVRALVERVEMLAARLSGALSTDGNDGRAKSLTSTPTIGSTHNPRKGGS
jgi:hypothetical protein